MATTTAEVLEFTVLYKKSKYSFSLPSTTTVSELRIQIKELTELPPVMQKLMHKGTTLKVPEDTLLDAGIRSGSKIMVVGSTFNDILETAVPRQELIKKYQSASDSEGKHVKEPLCRQTQHKKVLTGHKKPDDLMPAYKPDGTLCLSSHEPLKGLLNRFGSQIRLTFKLETDEIWISSKQSTTKIKMATINGITSEPIDGENDLYHIVGLKMGPETIWIYWVPVQYIQAIRATILGK